MAKIRERRPRFNISRITELRRQLRDDAFFAFYGARLDEHGFQLLLHTVGQLIPHVSDQVMQDSLQHLVGQVLTGDVLRETAWRLAGNVERLRHGVPALPWNGQVGKEWVPCHIVGFEPVDRTYRSGDRCASFTLQILAGSPCPRLITKEWPYKFCFMLARRMGYTATRGARPLGDVSELVNLRLLAQLDPALSWPGQPGFDKLHCGGALLQWNKSVIGRRFRTFENRPWPCPRNYNWRCYQCHVGFDQCIAATHPVTMQIGPAPTQEAEHVALSSQGESA
jgi:hypothetical protein